ETTALHRFELSGTLNGLFRAREFHQDDSHIFVGMNQVGEEFQRIIETIEIFYKAFDLKYKLRFGTRPENFMGEAKDWDIAERELKVVLDKSGQEYFEAAGEGAFYGPKIDILMKDSLGREWQTGTIQLDFQQPKNFKLKYTDSEGKDVQPAAFHVAIYGSFERFLGILIENFEGKLPTWLAPVQVALLPIADRHNDYAQSVAKELEKMGFRAEVDSSPERLQAKIRNATLQHVPFMGIIGDKEIENKAISVRKRSSEDLGPISLDQFLAQLKGEVENKVV
ncbi:MAG TPA: threonine--tRNA ligase, partial [Gammaproteobacteria bacterium]|nr:threonine--tRNA ligase [Gammaproteobacteria bacterium]